MSMVDTIEFESKDSSLMAKSYHQMNSPLLEGVAFIGVVDLAPSKTKAFATNTNVW